MVGFKSLILIFIMFKAGVAANKHFVHHVGKIAGFDLSGVVPDLNKLGRCPILQNQQIAQIEKKVGGAGHRMVYQHQRFF